MFARGAIEFAFRIYCGSLLGWGEYAPILRGADRDIEKLILSIRDRFKARVFEEKADHNSSGFILDRRNTRGVHFAIVIAITSKQCLTVGVVVIPGSRIADSKTRGVFDDEPCKEQARGLHDPNQHK